MARDAIAPDATLNSIRNSLADPEKFVRTILRTMHPCKRQHGNAHVRIGVTGEGRAPYHKVVYLDEDGQEQLYGSFAGKVMDQTYQVHEHTWSTASMSYEDVQSLIASITGYTKTKS